jgi:hypothetical protein
MTRERYPLWLTCLLILSLWVPVIGILLLLYRAF